MMTLATIAVFVLPLIAVISFATLFLTFTRAKIDHQARTIVNTRPVLWRWCAWTYLGALLSFALIFQINAPTSLLYLGFFVALALAVLFGVLSLRGRGYEMTVNPQDQARARGEITGWAYHAATTRVALLALVITVGSAGISALL